MTKRVSDMTPEEYERHRAWRNAYDKTPKGLQDKKNHQKNNRKTYNSYQAKYYAANKEKVARKDRRRVWREYPERTRRRKTLELLTKLREKAPRHSGREEIIADATLYVLEGYTIEDALAKASKQHNTEVRLQKSSTNFEEAYWL